jgi:hypothetical protein
MTAAQQHPLGMELFENLKLYHHRSGDGSEVKGRML